MKNCEHCKWWKASEKVHVDMSSNRFLHRIGYGIDAESYAECELIVFDSTDGSYEIGFSNNFGCKHFESNDTDN